MNRGVGRRPIFETERDARAFLTLLALAVRAGQIQLHAFSILATHYHLLVRCPGGELSQAMQRTQDMYARWFNRTRGRDGHVFRGRFTSRRIEDPVYFLTVVSYIDDNPRSAGMVADPRQYAYGSARWYASESGPRWLHRMLVEEHVCALTRSARYRAEDYPALWRTCAAWNGGQMAARYLADRSVPVAPLLELTRAGPEHVQRWLRRNALKEDGEAAACLVLPVRVVLALVRERGVVIRRRGRRRAGLRSPSLLHQAMGLLRSACGLTVSEVARHLGASKCTARRHLIEHCRGLVADADYAAGFAALVHLALVRAYGGVGGTPLPDLARAAGALDPSRV